MQLTIAKNIDELNHLVADWIIAYVENVLKTADRFTWVLSGGNTPKELYKLLASEKYKKRIDWKKLHFFWGDERYVPFSDARNNSHMAFEYLLDHVPVSPDQVHIMRTDIAPEVSSAAYKKLLHQYFPGNDRTFDLVLLGMGDNAHTLSLFPGHPVVREKNHWVKTVYLEAEKNYRITMTATVVNIAGCVFFLVSGVDKAPALYHVLKGKFEPDRFPAQIIQPRNNELYWWVDEAAASEIK